MLVETWDRRYSLGQKLECNESLEASILGLVDHSHTTATESF